MGCKEAPGFKGGSKRTVKHEETGKGKEIKRENIQCEKKKKRGGRGKRNKKKQRKNIEFPLGVNGFKMLSWHRDLPYNVNSKGLLVVT
jgi:hypothetical protein